MRGKGGWIVTPNLDILRQFTADPESRKLILAASHRVADGLPIVWASRLAGTPLPERVPGSDLVLSLPEAAERGGLAVFLPGRKSRGGRRRRSPPQVAIFPGFRAWGSYCPPFGFEDDPEELDRIKRALQLARPALVLVGLGFPKQERLIRSLQSDLPGNLVRGSWDLPQLPRPGAAARAGQPSKGWAWSGCTGSCTNRAGCSGATLSRASRSASGCWAGRSRIGSNPSVESSGAQEAAGLVRSF